MVTNIIDCSEIFQGQYEVSAEDNLANERKSESEISTPASQFTWKRGRRSADGSTERNTYQDSHLSKNGERHIFSYTSNINRHYFKISFHQ